MKTWCNRCKGSGGVDKQSITGFLYKDMCIKCGGKGYTENEKIEHEAKVGRATMLWFESDLSMYDVENDVAIHSVESLVDWAESEEQK